LEQPSFSFLLEQILVQEMRMENIYCGVVQRYLILFGFAVLGYKTMSLSYGRFCLWNWDFLSEE